MICKVCGSEIDISAKECVVCGTPLKSMEIDVKRPTTLKSELKGRKIRVVHYINQFFAGIGGVEKVDTPAELRVGEVLGPGMTLKANFGDNAEIVATIICGDSYFAENMDKAKEQIIGWVKEQNPDVFIAGPAFNAIRYGIACGSICEVIQAEFNIPTITAMYKDNPATEMFKDKVYVFPTKDSAAGMKDVINVIVPFVIKLASNREVGSSSEEGFM